MPTFTIANTEGNQYKHQQTWIAPVPKFQNLLSYLSKAAYISILSF
jgi:hypothetical protein